MVARKTALITAAGQGIGRAIAQSLIDAGHRVIATDRDPELLRSLDCEQAAMDVCDLDQIRRVIAPLDDLEILVNCAGIVQTDTAADTTDAGWNMAFDVNVRSMFWTVRASLPAMLARKAGSIINIGSVSSSITAVPQRFTYGTTKAAVIGLTKAIAVEYVRSGIRANAICPGPVETPSIQARMDSVADPAQRAAILRQQPMKRFGKADEIAGLAAYLASEAGAFTTGQAFVVDGGMTLAWTTSPADLRVTD